MPIDTNYRNVRRTPEGLFTIETKQQSERLLRVGELCQRCAQSTSCKMKRKLLRMLPSLDAQVRACGEFRFAIRFPDRTGTEVGEFVTHRIGRAWGYRIAIGDEVGLVDGEGELFGRAMVDRVRVFPKDVAVQRFAYRNHLNRHKNFSQSDVAVQERFAKTLRNLYGKLAWEGNDEITVIELVRHK